MAFQSDAFQGDTFQGAEGTHSYGYSQAQAKINSFGYPVFAQAIATIASVTTNTGQAQAKINQTQPRNYAQAQAIVNQYFRFAQVQAKIGAIRISQVAVETSYGSTSVPARFSQVPIETAYAANPNARFSQVVVEVLFLRATQKVSQSNALITTPINQQFGQALANIFAPTKLQVGQALATLFAITSQFGQASAMVVGLFIQVVAQAQSKLRYYLDLVYPGTSATVGGVGVNKLSPLFHITSGQYVVIRVINPPSDGGNIGYGSESGSINVWTSPSSNTTHVIGPAGASGDVFVYSWNGAGYRSGLSGSGTVHIIDYFIYPRWAQAGAYISGQQIKNAQAQTDIKQTYSVVAQSQANIKQVAPNFAQVNAYIKNIVPVWAQVQAKILGSITEQNAFAQAQTTIGAVSNVWSQAQAHIAGSINNNYAQANSSICSVLFKDTFSRTQSAGDLGTPDIGPDYTDHATNYNHITTDGSVATVSGPLPYDFVIARAAVAGRNFLASIDFKPAFSGSTTYAQIDLGINAGINFPSAYVFNDSGLLDGSAKVAISTATTYSDVSISTLDSTKWYTFKFLVLDGQSFAKVWERGTAEPGWQLSGIDSGLSTGTSIGFYSDVGATPASQQLDNFLVFDAWAPFNSQIGQIQATIKATVSESAQAQAWIKLQTVFAQSQSTILATSWKFAQARPKIKVENNNTSAQSQATVIYKQSVFTQAQSDILVTNNTFAQSTALIDSPIKVQWAQALASLVHTYRVFAQAQAIRAERVWKQGQAASTIETTYFVFAAATARVKNGRYGFGNASVTITRSTVWKAAQSQALIIRQGYAQANAQIHTTTHKFAQALAVIFANYVQAQAQATIRSPFKYAQVQAKIGKSAGYANAQSSIKQKYSQAAQAQAIINSHLSQQYAQALAKIKGTRVYSQALSRIRKTDIRFVQTMAYITGINFNIGQVQAYILPKIQSGQSQGLVRIENLGNFAQAAAMIGHIQTSNAQAYIYATTYLVKYNGYPLPGYAQSEAYTTSMNMQGHYTPYGDGSLSEYLGLENKMISLQMAVIGDTYRENKDQVQRAGTILRTSKSWTKLYIQNPDRYYLALTKSVKVENTADKTGKVLPYAIEWEAKPWLYSDQVYTVSGTGLITINRTIDDGGWAPTTVRVTGTNITISGYTSTEFAGFISVSGAVTNLVVTTEPFSATTGTTNMHLRMNPDYSLYVGPETTYVDVSGATSCVITYQNRWYL